MKGRARVALLAGLLMVGLGCSAVRGPAGGQSSPPAQVEFGPSVGMSAAEVKSILGEPALVERKGPDGRTEVWYYSHRVVILRNGRTAFTSALFASRS